MLNNSLANWFGVPLPDPRLEFPNTSEKVGDDYNPTHDRARLSTQFERILSFALGEKWWTLSELADDTGYGEASISAQLRHAENLFGYAKERRRRGDPARGLYEYRISYGRETPCK